MVRKLDDLKRRKEGKRNNNGFFIFVDDADDAAVYPYERLISITCAANATLKMNFESSANKTDGGDSVTLTITADKEVDVMNAIIENMYSNSCLVADDVNGEYLVPEITACAITLDT